MATQNADQQNGAGPKRYDYGGNPLAREDTSLSARNAAFGGELQPGLFRQVKDRKIANPAPLGLCGFALTTFLLSLINMGTLNLAAPNIVVGVAFAYGGLVQLLAGMWEMAVGNTFGATALGSYGGFWISFGIIFTPGGFQIEEGYMGLTKDFANAFSLYLFGWFIFTFLMMICTLRSTIAFFFLFFTLDMAFLMLALAWLYASQSTSASGTVMAAANTNLNIAGGVFGILAAFAAWYNAVAGILDRSNSFVLVPVAHFPWSEKGRERRGLPTMSDQDKDQEKGE